MSPRGQTVRCPQCGASFDVAPAPGPLTQWIPCPHCHANVPIVLPRDPPPLFSWEIYPGLYPIYIPPRAPRLRRRPATVYALFIALVLGAALVGTLGYLGVAAQRPASYTVSGTVENAAGAPITGATVVLTNDANQSTETVTGVGGAFSFSNVPIGGVLVNATDPGYAFTAVLIFVSTVYISTGSTTGIGITLDSDRTSNGTTILTTPFGFQAGGALELFVTDVWSAAGLLGLVVVVDAVAIARTLRSARPIAGVAGGIGSMLAPLPIALLNIEIPFPIPSLLTIGVAVLGGFAVGIGLIEMAQGGEPTPPGQ